MRKYSRLHESFVYVHMYMYVAMYTYVHMYMYVCICTYVYVRMYVCMWIFTDNNKALFCSY